MIFDVNRILIAAIVALATTKPMDPIDPTDNPQAAAQDLTQKAKDILKRMDKLYAEWNHKQSIAGWNYASNLTDENLTEKLNVSAAAARVTKQVAQEVNEFPWRELQDENLKRQFQKFSILGTAALPEEVRICEKFRLIISL